jgi:gliding motility-associated-like protein
MRAWLLLTAFTSIVNYSFGQKNKPKIEEQRPVSTDEDRPVTIRLTDLVVRDRDDWFYPFGFTLKIHPGDNYTFLSDVVTPALNFNGKLKVTVTVNDGEHDSQPYNMDITVNPVNDPPVIASQTPLTTNENQALTIKLSDLTIVDPDDNQFTLGLQAGANYTLSANTITPSPNYSGPLTVPVFVNDGKVSSSVFNLKIDVLSVNDIPKITGQAALSTNENTPITIQLSNLTVTDTDNAYPTGFTLHIAPANNTYSVNGNIITPALNFEGTLSIPLRVNDGTDFSPMYNLQITVRPGNNSPTITGQIASTIDEDEIFNLLPSHLIVSDSDNSYPAGFAIRISNGPNYSVVSNQITPGKDFTGRLSVSVVVNDGTSDSAPYSFVLNVLPKNDLPVVTLEPDALIFQPTIGPIPISELLQITDAENDSITKAEITFFPQTYTPGFDELKYQGSEIIKGTFDFQRGIIELTGKAAINEYVKAIKSIQYNFIAGPSFREGKKFSITVSDKVGNSAPATREIRTKAIDIDLDIPSAFTPNGDNSNDTWEIKPLKLSEELNQAVVRVYSKGGHLLFETIGFEKEWDGRFNGEVLPSDSYFYTIDLGKNYINSSLKGIVIILR